MCEKCDEVDAKIAHYKAISYHVGDQITRDGIADLINRLSDEKAAFGCEVSKRK
jgi:hypothetical protein